jgi:histidinol-phosphate aminotransferase
MTIPPTYGMYKVQANVNDVGVVEVPLVTEGGAFQLDEEAVSNGCKPPNCDVLIRRR